MLYANPDVACDRRARQDFYKFKALIATPGNLATGVTLPSNGYFYVKYSLALAAPTVVLTVNNGQANARNIGAPTEGANAFSAIGELHRGVVIARPAGLVGGTVQVYVRNGLGHRYLIAQG